MTAIALLFIPLALGPLAIGAPDPYLVESKVQLDLDSGLAKILPRDLFLVQIHTEVVTKSERKLIEGETIQDPQIQDEQIESDEPMPGFIPEPESLAIKKLGPRIRQVFRIVDRPELAMVRVLVSFDDTLPADVVDKARGFVQRYLQGGYPQKSSFTFNKVPMLKPPVPKSEPASPVEFDDEDTEEEGFEFPKAPPVLETPKPAPTWKDKAWDSKWFFLAFLGALLYFVLHWRSLSVRALKKKTPAVQNPHPLENLFRILIPGAAGAKDAGSQNAAAAPAAAGGTTPNTDEEAVKRARRNKILEKYLSQSRAFGAYYKSLSPEEKDELYSVLKGPTMDGLMVGLGLTKPKADVPEAGNPDEVFEKHERNFNEFASAREWQSKQFFGFLNELSEEQLVSLVNHETPIAVCAMLRFMKAQQSASILEALPPGRRLEILAAVPQIQTTPFSELVNIEREVRTVVQMMPAHLFGAKKQDVEYWGNVLAESTNQDIILADLEKTNPEIYPDLSKFKFKLEDVSTLPDSLLQTILAEADNEELAMALSTCPDDVVEVILEAISPRRQEMLRQTIQASKSAPKDQTKAARVMLTKKFREAMQ